MYTIKQIDQVEEAIIEQLGAEGALEAITKALSYDTKNDIYHYIVRCYEIELEEES